MASKLIPAAFIGLIFVFYGIIALRRKAKLRSLALKLGATHVDKGLFAPGNIVGSDFSIEVHTRGFGRYKRFWTTLKVSAPKLPGNYLVKAGFFDKYPDWTFVKILGVASQRVFIAAISFPRYVEPSAAERDALLSWLGRSSVHSTEVHEALKKNQIDELVFSEASLAVSLKGIVLNLDRLRGVLDTLRLLAR